MGVRLFKKFLSAPVDTHSKNLDKTALSHITPSKLMRKDEITQVSLNGETPVDLAIGRRPRDFMDFASMNPEQLTSTPTKQDLLNEEIQKLVMKTNSEVQQREDVRRDLTEGMICVLPDLPLGEQVFYWQQDPSKVQQGRKSGKWSQPNSCLVHGLVVVCDLCLAITSPALVCGSLVANSA